MQTWAVYTTPSSPGLEVTMPHSKLEIGHEGGSRNPRGWYSIEKFKTAGEGLKCNKSQPHSVKMICAAATLSTKTPRRPRHVGEPLLRLNRHRLSIMMGAGPEHERRVLGRQYGVFTAKIPNCSGSEQHQPESAHLVDHNTNDGLRAVMLCLSGVSLSAAHLHRAGR
jgi:hypothetical protein